MNNKKNLWSEEAIEKIRSLAKGIDVCMFCTELGNIPFQARPMSTQEVDKEGNVWFLSNADSHKNSELKDDDDVQLLYADRNNAHFLSVYGKATVLRDQEKIEEYWNPLIKAWFKKGKYDPKITVIRVTPKEGYYWDTKSGKLVALLKIAVAAVSGADMDDSIEGALKPAASPAQKKKAAVKKAVKGKTAIVKKAVVKKVAAKKPVVKKAVKR